MLMSFVTKPAVLLLASSFFPALTSSQSLIEHDSFFFGQSPPIYPSRM